MASRFWVGGTGTWDAANTANWSTTTGGAGGASVPGSGDFAILDANSGSGIVTLAYFAIVGSFRTAGYIGTFDFSTYDIECRDVGTVVFSGSTSATYVGSKNLKFTTAASSGTRSISFVGATESNAINIAITAGTDSINTQGNWANLDTTGFSGTFNNNARSIYGDWIISSTMTLAAGTNTTVFRSTSGPRSITTNGNTLDFPLAFDGIGGEWNFQDALTQGSTRNFTVTNGIVRLKNGATSTVGSFLTSGTNQKFLESTLAGSQATLSQASGTVSVNNLTIKDINATGGATWNAYVTNNNINVANNTGWDFYLPVNSIYDSLRLRGYTGTVTDMLLQYYKANGATSNSLQDAESEFLILKGFTSGSNTDKWYAYLRSLSFTGTVTDMLFNYWKDPA